MTMTTTTIEKGSLTEKLYDFIEILRDANVTISADEVLSIFGALPHISILDKEAFEQTLRTTLIKDYTDLPVFAKCFAEFFEGVEGIHDELDALSLLKKNSSLSESDMEKLEEGLDQFLDEISENLMFEKKSEEKLLQLFLEEMEVQGGSGGLGMTLFQARSEFIQSYNNQGDGQDGDEGQGEAEFNNILLEMIKNRVSKKKIGKEIKNREDFLLNRFIYQLTPEEIKEMKELVKRFGQKLKNRISLRKKRIKRGRIDIKRTMRTSMQYGGVPFKIFNKDRKIDRPQLVILCDVSGSVNQYTRFMLLLTHALQSLFSKVRTFAFISNMVEITDLFMEMDPERAINSIFADTNFTYGWGSNYGRSFDQFIGDHSDSLNHKTTVLVLGDGRNNHQDPGLDSFIRIKERSRNIFWLNPDKEHLWNWSDSIATLYRQYCTEMKEVNSFLDLSEFIDKLFTDM
ncbi:MAG: VWA domain-containing protein [bacterium]|nr:VWA domain-containing protein [bacterium]